MSNEQKIISLVNVHGPWYVPNDSVAYNTLKDAGFKNLKLHNSVFPLLKLACKRNNIRITSKSFQDKLDLMMQRVSKGWSSVDGRLINQSGSKFQLTAESNKRNSDMSYKIEIGAVEFFSRWGFRCNHVFSESKGRMKLLVSWEFDPAVSPVIKTVEEPIKTKHEFILGFTKISLEFTSHKDPAASKTGIYTLLQVSTKAGDSWIPVHSASFKDQAIGDLSPLAESYGMLLSRLTNG